MDKNTQQTLSSLLRNINPKKLNQLKNTLNEQKDLGALLENLDTKKAQAMLKNLKMENVSKEADLSGAIKELKNHPELIEELKKML